MLCGRNFCGAMMVHAGHQIVNIISHFLFSKISHRTKLEHCLQWRMECTNSCRHETQWNYSIKSNCFVWKRVKRKNYEFNTLGWRFKEAKKKNKCACVFIIVFVCVCVSEFNGEMKQLLQRVKVQISYHLRYSFSGIINTRSEHHAAHVNIPIPIVNLTIMFALQCVLHEGAFSHASLREGLTVVSMASTFKHSTHSSHMICLYGIQQCLCIDLVFIHFLFRVVWRLFLPSAVGFFFFTSRFNNGNELNGKCFTCAKRITPKEHQQQGGKNNNEECRVASIALAE